MLSLRYASRPTILATLALAVALTLVAVAFAAPSLSIVSGPSGPTRDTTPSFGFEVDAGATVECSIDAGTPDYGACDSDSGHSPAGPLADGDYVFRVRATDASEEQSEATRAFTVDTAAPTLSISSGPSGPISDSTPTFGFDASGHSTLECSVDQGSASWGACGGAGSHEAGPLADGDYTFRVRATDAAGNATTRTRSFTVDTTAPTATIDSAPAAVSNDPTPTFELSSDEAGAQLQCRLDGGGFANCDSPRTYGPLAEGPHTFAVRALDAAGNVGPEDGASFAIDLTSPTLTILSGPDGPTNEDAPEFGFQAEAGTTVECSVDQGAASWTACSGAATHSPATLADGSHTFRVRATDGAGNVTTRTRAFSVDTVAPVTTIDSTPLGTTDDQTPAFAFSASEGDVTFQCRFDGPTFSSCTSPRSYGPLGEGAHSFAVRAVDAAGNIGAEDLESFTVDLTNPTLAIVDGPEGATNDSTPEWSFDAESGSEVECSVDQGTAAWAPCDGDGSHAPGTLADGAYSFRVRATDGAGHTTVEVRSFVVDTAAPSAAIASGPSGPTNDVNPTFGLTSNEAGASFECRLDSPTFAPCAASKAYSSLAQGAHTFAARARDAAGNVGNVAIAEFSIDTVAPTVAISFGPSGATTDDSPLFEFAANGHSAVACSVDQGTPAWGPCTTATAHVVTSRLPNGAYTFRVRASDPAGNSATATRSFVVATASGPPTTPTQPTPPPTTAAAPRLMSPFPLVRLSGRLTETGAKVQILTVRAPRGARVQIKVQPRCAKGSRCRAKQSAASIGPKGIVRFKRLEVAYSAGTKIEVRVSQLGLIGKYTRFTVRRGKAPQRLDRCLMPGATRGSACPAG